MSRQSYILRRLLQAVVALFVVTTIMFVLFRIAPSDPASVALSPSLSPKLRQAKLAQFGLDKPLIVQYKLYLQNALALNFGQSYFYREPVSRILARRMTNTFVLMAPALLIAYSLGTVLGGWAAWRRGHTPDRAVLVAATLFRSVPSFVLSLVLLYVFSFKLQWLPNGHMVSPTASFSSNVQKFVSVAFLKHVLLPVVSIVPFLMAYPVLLMRTTMLETLNEDFITMCHAKGLTARRVFVDHAVRNSLIPLITTMPIILGLSVTGNILVESIYSWPGIGSVLVQSLLKGDYPLSQGAFLLIAAIIIAGNFVVDVVYSMVDPRIEYN